MEVRLNRDWKRKAHAVQSRVWLRSARLSYPHPPKSSDCVTRLARAWIVRV